MSARPRLWPALARLAVSVALLWAVSRRVDVGGVLARLADLAPGWVALGLAITVAQVALLAWRWRYTADRLGVELSLRAAVSEYYLGILLNQLLPGGVAGDVGRAWRHARAEPRAGPAVRAVILERASAQMVMTLTAAGSVAALPWAPASVRVGAVAMAVVLAAAAAAWLAPSPSADRDSALGRLRMDARRALLARDALAPQLSSALLVVASYIVVFAVAARAIGTAAPASTLLPLVAPVLMTMLVPVTIAGWGIREAAATALWGLAGLAPEEGAAVSVAYGLLVLVSSAPGLLVLTGVVVGGPGRRGRPRRG